MNIKKFENFEESVEKINEKLFEPHLKQLEGKKIILVEQENYPITNIYFDDDTYLELTPFKNEWGPSLQLRIKNKK